MSTDIARKISATIAASSIGESTALRRSFGPIGMSSTDCRWRHVGTVLVLIPYRFARLAIKAYDRCNSPRMAWVVLVSVQYLSHRSLRCDGYKYRPTQTEIKHVEPLAQNDYSCAIGS